MSGIVIFLLGFVFFFALFRTTTLGVTAYPEAHEKRDNALVLVARCPPDTFLTEGGAEPFVQAGDNASQLKRGQLL